MKLLLRSDVSGIGKKGDIVEVADGYGRNYLLPKGFAILATGSVEAQASSMRRSRDQHDLAARTAASEIAAKLVPAVIAVSARAKAEGELFGSVTITEIVDAVNDQTGIELDRHTLHVDEPIKTLGTHTVGARLHPEVQFLITVEVTAA
jgi:large subunit ribosomal protein L9